MFRTRFHATGTLAAIIAMLSNGALDAEIRFHRTLTWEPLVDAVRFSPNRGLYSTPWDSAAADTAITDTTGTVPAAPDSARADSIQAQRTVEPDTTVEQTPADDTGSAPPSGVETSPPIGAAPPASASSGASGASGASASTSGKPSEQYDGLIAPQPEAAPEPLPYRPTLAKFVDLPVEYAAEFDSTTGYVVVKPRLNGVDIPYDGAITIDEHLARATQRADREARLKGIDNKLPKTDKSEGTGIKISIPVFRSKRAQRIFGGSDVGLTVAGDIRVDGSLRTEKREEQQTNDPNPTSYQFKVDQTQRFNIKGNVGEKVAVEIDQDSERLFEFENNLRLTYTGDPDEIIQKIEAGNVNLSLRGAKLASASSQHKGLFGLKTETQFGALRLTTVASLEKGEKRKITVRGGAESGRWIEIDPKDFVKGRYFFLDYKYRENYRQLNPGTWEHVAVPAIDQIIDIEVYVASTGRAAGQEQNLLPAWAQFDPSEPPPQDPDPDHQWGRFRRLDPADYEVQPQVGYIRLRQSVGKSDILAVAYSTPGGNYGDLIPPAAGDTATLKLLKPENPQPPDSAGTTNRTWKLMWRNVYDLGSTGIDAEGFECKIERSTGGAVGERQDTDFDANGVARSYLNLFNLDTQDELGSEAPDDRVDQAFLRLGLGELWFPDLQPFEPEGWIRSGDFSNPIIPELPIDTLEALFSPELYTVPEGTRLNQVDTKFSIVVKYSNVSANYRLDFNVLEGSEEVLLNGQRLQRGTDYTIDYMSGELTILRKDALSANADLEIKYEAGQTFQLDTKTLLGLRAEFELWEDSFIGTTMLHMNQKTRESRVRLGSEPTRNSIWDINAVFTLKPQFLTWAVDKLPLVSTDAPSKLTIEGEVAQVFPDPNNIDSPSTGDYNGVAYVDDFESIKRSSPLGISFQLWSPASYPDLHVGGNWRKQRGRLIWYNPYEQVNITDIWPEREVEAQVSKTSVLKIDFQPWWTTWGGSQPPEINPERSWGGIMRYLGAGYADQSESKYIEIWMNRGAVNSGIMFIDLGQISEDVIPNGKLDTEDKPTGSLIYGNDVLDEGEDTGIDGIMAADPNDSTWVNGESDADGNPILLPSYDDWNYDYQQRSDYSHINGTEGNAKSEVGSYPDTEDLNGDKYLDRANDYFRYKIDLSEGDENRYIAGGLNLPPDKEKGWRLYRIPLLDTISVGRPSLAGVEYVRLWFTGFRRSGQVQIAQIEIVGNEWQEVEEEDARGSFDPVSVAVINTHDNPEYTPPPGVSGEVDPVTNLAAQEQSLVLRVNRIGTGEAGRVFKYFRQKMSLLEYRYLKMFVHGGGPTPVHQEQFRRQDVEMFFRFGKDTSENYYEYSQKVYPGWDERNEIIIDLARIALLKFMRQDSLQGYRNYDVLPDGDVIRVSGDASLSEIRYMIVGIRNYGAPISETDQVELWLDEMRVSDIDRDPGWAARGSAKLDLADFISISADVTQQQANYHDVNQRKGSDRDQLRGQVSGSIKFDKFFNPQWGVRLPFNVRASQDVYVPKYQPGSDIKISTILERFAGAGGSAADRKVDIWKLFIDNLGDNSRYSDAPRAVSPVDSFISTRKTYGFSTDISKGKRSSNKLVAYTLDRMRLGGSHTVDYSSDSQTAYRIGRQEKVEASYDFTFDKPVELSWLSWAQTLPLLKKLSAGKFRPLPSSFSFSLNGTESDDLRKSRSGTLTPRYSVAVDRNFRIGFRPVTMLSFDYQQQIESSRIPQDSTRMMIVLRHVDLDSSAFWIPTPPEAGEDSIFDSTAYKDAFDREILRLQREIFWKAFGNWFVNDGLSQSFSMNLNPQFISWLGTDANYNARYRWSWSESHRPEDRQVSVNSSLTTSLTFRLQQLTAGWGREGPGGGAGAVPGVPGAPAGKGAGSGRPPPRGNITMPDLPSAPVAGDSLAPAESDTLGKTAAPEEERLRRKPPNPLLPLKMILKRLRDIRWDYSLVRDNRASGVGLGQASWRYRLGLSDSTGLSRIPGFIARDTYARRDEHRLSTGLEVTRTLSISNLNYTFNNSVTEDATRRKSGTTGRTVWQMFGSDGVSIEAFPATNWTIRFTGLGDLAMMKKVATSVSLENSFQGSATESWKQNPDSARETSRIEYEKNFSPLAGLSFSWIGGVGTTIRYNFTQRVSDERYGLQNKTKSTTRTISLSASYTSRRGFRIPIPVWPFNNKRLKNSTSFSLAYNYSTDSRATSTGGEPFDQTSGSSSWSVSPSIEYAFSNTVRGSFRYEYASRKSINPVRKTRTQDFGFSVNISIRG